jgi:hypothetical protein
MTVIELLDSELSPIIRHQVKGLHEYVLNRCLSPDARNYNWKDRTTTVTEEVFASNLPETASSFHTNYLEYLQDAYSVHHKIVIAPHHFWYSILCEIAQTVVSTPDLHRSLFTRDPAGKIDIIVPCSSETEPLRMDALYKEMIGYIPIDTDLFLPTFTTSTEMSKLASLAAFLETCSPYYSYMMLLCGYPAVRLDGTKADWEMVTTKLVSLGDEFLHIKSPLGPWVTDTICPIAEKLLGALDNKNVDWLRQIFTQQKCGSGSQYVVDGWFSRLFIKQPEGLPEVCNFPSHISKVPYTTLPSGTKWNMCFALTHSNRDADGFMVPDYSWVQVRKLAEPKVI